MQGEIFAAEGYGKVTGEVGVCIATSGPGATNLVTGLADALLDSVPMVAITGQVDTLATADSAWATRQDKACCRAAAPHQCQPLTSPLWRAAACHPSSIFLLQSQSESRCLQAARRLYSCLIGSADMLSDAGP